MSEIADAARARRLHPDAGTVTGHGHPVLRGWCRLDDYVDPKLVGTDPTGQAWVIEKVEAGAGPVWLAWPLEEFESGEREVGPSVCSLRSDAVDYVSNMAALTPAATVIE